MGRQEPLRFLDINLRGIGQVMFQNNPLTGLLFLLAVGWGSYAASMPQVFIGGLLAVVAATLTAQWLHLDEADLASGLYGYNAYLVGLALGTFLAPGPLLWAYVVLGGAVSVVATLATANMFKTWGVAALTAPFVLVAWLLLLATFAFSGIDGSALGYGGNAVTASIRPPRIRSLQPISSRASSRAFHRSSSRATPCRPCCFSRGWR